MGYPRRRIMLLKLVNKVRKKNEKNISLQEIAKNEWHFVYGETFGTLIMDVFDGACDELDNGEYDVASIVFQQLINEVPEFVDAYNHLALISLWSGQDKQAQLILEEGIEKAINLFPDNFFEEQNRLEWGWIDNRPFLRSYANLGIFYFDNKSFDKAKFIFERILIMNPNDNQGVRDPLLNCYLKLGLLDAASALCDRYRQDFLVGIKYGRVLVLYQQGKQKEAQKQLISAMRYSPLVAKELIKLKHIKPKNYGKGPGIALGSQEEAYEYWSYYGKLWKSTSGAITFVKKCIESSRKKIKNDEEEKNASTH